MSTENKDEEFWELLGAWSPYGKSIPKAPAAEVTIPRTPENDLPFVVTDQNIEEVRISYPNIGIMITKRCPICTSYLVTWTFTTWDVRTDKDGKILRGDILTGGKVICPNCKRLTVDDPSMPDNENPPMHATPFEPNWVRCPNCRRGFQLDHDYEWTGERHQRCGQRLIIHDN